MNSIYTRPASLVLLSENEIPPHLIQRQPFCLNHSDIILRYPEKDVFADDGRVLMAGAIEFQTKIQPGLLTEVCDPDELYKTELCGIQRFRCVYDPQIQRGLKETKIGPKEFLREKQIQSMMRDIEANRFQCPPLIWNLRARETVWVYLKELKQLRIYQGVATRPDTNHRHHAIIRFHRRYLRWVAETNSEKMGDYNPDRAYGLVIHTDDFRGEAHRFCVYNFLGWRMPATTAHYIESKTQSPHIHSRLARELMERSSVLGTANVEILSNQLSKYTPKMVTFGTLVDSLRKAFPNLSEESYAEILDYLVEYIGELNRIRPHEIAPLSLAQRQKIREDSVALQTPIWEALIKLAAWLREENQQDWRGRLQALATAYTHVMDGQTRSYDLFSRNNPIWLERGLLAFGKSGLTRVVNTRSSRQVAFELLRFLAVCHPEGQEGVRLSDIVHNRLGGKTI